MLNDAASARYQLTPIGRFTEAIVAREVKANRFVIRTRAPRTKVSWEVVAERADRALKAQPFVAEEAKKVADRGKYFQPELFGKPLSTRIGG